MPPTANKRACAKSKMRSKQSRRPAHNRLLHRQTDVHKALSALVCNRAPFHQLFVGVGKRLGRLRGIRKCFYKIQSAL